MLVALIAISCRCVDSKYELILRVQGNSEVVAPTSAPILPEYSSESVLLAINCRTISRSWGMSFVRGFKVRRPGHVLTDSGHACTAEGLDSRTMILNDESGTTTHGQQTS